MATKNELQNMECVYQLNCEYWRYCIPCDNCRYQTDYED